MANRTKVLETLDNYFKSKGRVLSLQEYIRETDTPIRIQQIRNIFGSWNRVEKLLMAREERLSDPDAITDVNDVIAARNRALYDADKAWRAASENQDAKARREAEAQVVAEQLALNAATPEGANANKIALGGPLPSEQPDYSKMGATVKTNPATKEQVVVDPDVEVVTTVTENPKTPEELKAAVVAEGVKTGSSDVPVGHETDGGSQGHASIATASALAGDESEDKPSKTSTTKK